MMISGRIKVLISPVYVVAMLIVPPTTLTAQNSEPPPNNPVEEQTELPSGGADSDPVQIVLLNLRNEYYDLNGGNWTDAVIIRSDRAFLKKSGFGGKMGLLTRFDFPIQTAEVSSSTHVGLGDLYTQAAFAPFLTDRFAFFFGSGMVFPTATHDTLGAGKWTASPLAGPIYFFGGRRGFAFVKVQEYISFAGDSDRPDKNYLLVTPTMILALNPGWWVLLQEESRIDFNNDNRVWYKAGVQLGHMFTKKFGFWVQPELLWGASRPGDYNLKCSFVWNR